MSKYKGMTVEEHKEAAKLLQEVNDAYAKLLRLVSGKYPVVLVDKIIRECNVGFSGKIRSELDDYFYKENPKWSGNFIYYASNESEKDGI